MSITSIALVSSIVPNWVIVANDIVQRAMSIRYHAVAHKYELDEEQLNDYLESNEYYSLGELVEENDHVYRMLALLAHPYEQKVAETEYAHRYSFICEEPPF